MENSFGLAGRRRFDGAGAAIFLLLFCLGVCAIYFKAYFFPDELLSYVLANNSVSGDCATSALNWNVPLNRFFVPASAYFDTMLAASEHLFDYANVWRNQACDTHPPLYYALLHTLSSLCPGHFSRFCAGAINVLFALLTLVALRKLVRVFTDDRIVLAAISAVFALSSTVLNSVACLRMYIMAMFWITLYTYILVKTDKAITDWGVTQASHLTKATGHCADSDESRSETGNHPLPARSETEAQDPAALMAAKQRVLGQSPAYCAIGARIATKLRVMPFNGLDRGFYVSLFAVALSGILTHYHCLLYFALASLVFAIYLLRDGHYGEFALFAAAQFAALITAWAIFPAMSYHLLHGFHSAQFASNLTGSSLTQRVWDSLCFFNSGLFGGLLILLTAAIAVLYFHCRRKRKQCFAKQHIRGICLIALPALLFTVIVSKTLPYADEYEHFRYFIPIFALLYAACLLPLFILLKQTLDARRAKLAIIAVTMAIIAGSWLNTDRDKAWLYLGCLKNSYAQTFNDAVCIRIGTELMQYSYEFYRFAGQLWFPAVHEALKSPAFVSVIKNHDKIAISFLENGNISDAATDAMLFQMLEAAGEANKFSIVRTPCFYDTLYPQRHQGCIYYLSR